MTENFLLNTETSKKLYNSVKTLPVIDYHNHLSLEEISKNIRYTDVYDMWIKPDPYKHRAMRMAGVPEEYITGDKSKKEKFVKWCETIPLLVGNPLVVWTKMELETVFDIDEMPNAQNGEKLYNMCNEYLKNNVVTSESLLKLFNAEFICPCMSLADDVEIFSDNTGVAPSLRGDDIVNVTCDFIKKLENVSKIKIDDLKSFEKAVISRLKEFAKCGTKFSDHALDNGFKFYEDDGKNQERFYNLKNNKQLLSTDKDRLSSYILEFLAVQYSKLNFIMQLHIGALRYTSSVLREKAGAAGGFAGIGNSVDAESLTKFLDAVDKKETRLPKTILFTLNPADNALISVLSGSYSKDGVKGLVTQGPAWWWCDHKQGIRNMLENNAVYGLLSNFAGMTTDSRSILSFVRHDYFRRIVCDFLGEKFEKGDLCCTFEELENVALNMCYKNAKELIGGN